MNEIIMPKLLGNVYNEKFQGGDFGGCVWDNSGIAPTLKTTAASSQQCVIEESNQYGQTNKSP